MATTINADKTIGSAIVTADTSGVLSLQAAGVTVLSLDSSQTATFTGSLVASGLTYPSADGSSNQAIVTNGSGSLSFATVSLTPQVITANATAVAGNHYFLDSAGITLTLPATPSTGDRVGVSEVAGDTTSIIGRNGSNIMSDASDLTLDVAYEKFILTYTGATVGWAFS